jgi:TRAP-type C4-dicarboxylate transport system substrate-binding protein
MPESYQSLQKGVVDGSMHPVESNKGWKLWEVTRNATFAYPAAYTTTFFVVMNKAKWDKLAPGDQKIIEAIDLEWAPMHGEAWDESDMEGLRFFQQQGNTIFGLDAKESARWAAAVAPLIDASAAELDKNGLNGKAVIETIRESLKKFE